MQAKRKTCKIQLLSANFQYTIKPIRTNIPDHNIKIKQQIYTTNRKILQTDMCILKQNVRFRNMVIDITVFHP